jgi:hypothetical protein
LRSSFRCYSLKFEQADNKLLDVDVAVLLTIRTSKRGWRHGPFIATSMFSLNSISSSDDRVVPGGTLICIAASLCCIERIEGAPQPLPCKVQLRKGSMELLAKLTRHANARIIAEESARLNVTRSPCGISGEAMNALNSPYLILGPSLSLLLNQHCRYYPRLGP